jgi:hypothetical protein
LFHPRPLNAAEIGAASRPSRERIVTCVFQAVCVVWLAVLDPTVGYAGGDNGEDHRDQWLRVECARKEIRRQQNEER